jgi:hypothetical protein
LARSSDSVASTPGNSAVSSISARFAPLIFDHFEHNTTAQDDGQELALDARRHQLDSCIAADAHAAGACDYRSSAASNNCDLYKTLRQEGSPMTRISGVDPKKTSFLMRQVFRKVRKMLGRELTPQKIQARVPRLFWFNILGEWLLGQRAKVSPRLRALVTLRTAVRVGCPF